MKYLLVLVLAITMKSQGQHLLIEYRVRFNDLYDRGRSDRLHNGHLLIAGNISRYYTVETEKYKPRSENDVMIMPDTANQVFINMSNGTLIAQEADTKAKTFFVSDSLHPMNWIITAEERKIDSFNCVKAESMFRGRRYIAWFTPDLPIPLGPWKMGGLPGLIVDLQDADENLLVQLKSIISREVEVNIPAEVKYTREEHVAAIKSFIRRVKENARAGSPADCINCQQQSVLEFFAWEKIPL